MNTLSQIPKHIVSLSTLSRISVYDIEGSSMLCFLRDLQQVLDSGIRGVAIVLKHAAIFPDHEQAVGKIAREVGFQQV